MKVGIATFGCKVNQYETNYIIESLKDKYDISGILDKCDVYIINSCAVTSKASKECRELAHRILKRNPDSKILYIGCDAYISKKMLDERIIVLGNSYKIAVDKAIKLNYSDISSQTKHYMLNYAINNFGYRNRAFIKIQEGCNNHCTYCVIPYVRGKQRDKDKNLVINEILSLSEKYNEIVLTGTNIGSYKDFKTLLKTIGDLKLSSRIRISSIEPMYVDQEIIDILVNNNFARHLHMPLQSGSDKILKLMARSYIRKDYEKIVNYANKKGIFVGTDIIVGFLGENEYEFNETKRFIEDLPVVYGHIFTYSKRQYTKALNLGLKGEKGPIVRMRSKMLKSIFHKKFTDKLDDFVGKSTDIVVENRKVRRNNKEFYIALASEYFKVLANDKRLKNVVIKEFDGEFCYS